MYLNPTSNFQNTFEIIQRLFNLSQEYKKIGLIHKSCISLIKAIKIDKNIINLYINLASNLVVMEKNNLAMAVINKGLKIDSRNILLLNNKANLYEKQGHINLSIAIFKKLIQIEPRYFVALFNLGRIYRNLGKFEISANYFDKARQQSPNNLKVLFESYRMNKNKVKVEKLNKIIKLEPSAENSIYFYFLKGKIECENKNFEEEIKNLKIAHSLYFKLNTYFSEFNFSYEKKIFSINKLTEHISESKLSKKIHPIFIVGLPRSGSTLIEKIICSSKPEIQSLEETQIFFNKLNKINIKNKKIKSIDEILHNYKKLKNINFEYRFTDKSLENFEFINLIKKTLPNAKIINCIRDPRESIISILKNNLISVPWAHRMPDILKYFDRYYKIINKLNFKNQNFIYNLKFEDLLRNPKIVTKTLFDFCGIEWTESCLNFYKNKIYTQTTNNEQLRGPININNFLKYKNYEFVFTKIKKEYDWLK